MNFFIICGVDEDKHYVFLGDLTIMDDDTAIVNNDYDGTGNRYFDTSAEAVRYVETRVCAEPLYWDPERKAFARISVLSQEV